MHWYSYLLLAIYPYKIVNLCKFQVIGLGKSGRAATKLALARGASVIAIDQNENLSLLKVHCLLSSMLISIMLLLTLTVKSVTYASE